MNIFELKKKLSEENQGKTVRLVLDAQCASNMDVSIINGQIAVTGHITYNKVRVEIDGEAPYYENIKNHREGVGFMDFKAKVASYDTAFVADQLLASVDKYPPQDRENALNQIAEQAGLERSEIDAKMSAMKAKPSTANVSIVVDEAPVKPVAPSGEMSAMNTVAAAPAPGFFSRLFKI